MPEPTDTNGTTAIERRDRRLRDDATVMHFAGCRGADDCICGVTERYESILANTAREYAVIAARATEGGMDR